jgi:hypothetical protein
MSWGKYHREYLAMSIRMTLKQLRVWTALVTYADDDGRCWPCTATLGGLTGIPRENVSKCITALEKMGAVKIDRHPGRANHYLLQKIPVAESATSGRISHIWPNQPHPPVAESATPLWPNQPHPCGRIGHMIRPLIRPLSRSKNLSAQNRPSQKSKLKTSHMKLHPTHQPKLMRPQLQLQTSRFQPPDPWQP